MLASPAPKTPDDVSAGANALIEALAAASKSVAESRADPNVAIVFALGWQIAELYRPDPPTESASPLPGLGALGSEDRALISLAQVDVALRRLAEPIEKLGLTPPTTDAARAALAAGNFPAAILELHTALVSILIAADFKLGKAYELGRSMADTCREPRNLDEVLAGLRPARIAALRARISDLTSVLPPHAGHGVRGSIDEWVAWAGALERQGGGVADEALVIDLLRRQGERWRALLSAEKAATDVLEFEHYLTAGEGLTKQFSTLARRFLRRSWGAVLLVLVLVGAAVAFILTNPDSTAHVTAGLGGLLATVGITWKGVGVSLGRAMGRLEQPLWGAELDAAVTEAIRLVPGSAASAGFTPPPSGRTAS
ncbi:MAG: hypothetical protein ACR2KV_12610 [Solirubrobacteraceae bacterium]